MQRGKGGPQHLDRLNDVMASARPELLRQKLALCSVCYDFSADSEQLELKDEKRQTLLELIEFVNTRKAITEDNGYKETIHMVRSNLFRSLPPSPAFFDQNEDADEDADPSLRSAWPHLQLVYEFFLRFIVSSDLDPKAAKKHIDKSCISKLLVLFESEDPRERDYLKTILHRIYGKFMSHRPFIRRAISCTFYGYIYESEHRHAGISELLEILGSVINGFATPLKGAPCTRAPPLTGSRSSLTHVSSLSRACRVPAQGFDPTAQAETYPALPAAALLLRSAGTRAGTGAPR
jgi:serine/threonine-protein phosphatase 2A regulatory subunit B'